LNSFLLASKDYEANYGGGGGFTDPGDCVSYE